MTKSPVTFRLSQRPLDMRLFRNLLIAILFYFSTFHNGVSANNINGTAFKFNFESKSDSIKSSAKTISFKGKRVYKNYI